MSDTPRTDKIYPDYRAGAYDRMMEHARQLERELAIANRALNAIATIQADQSIDIFLRAVEALGRARVMASQAIIDIGSSNPDVSGSRTASQKGIES